MTGAPLVEPAQARFVLTLSEPTADSLGTVKTATASDPHTACLVVQRVEKLGPDGEVTLTLTGPGVDGQCDLGVTGLSPEFFATRAELCANFPAGIDVLLVTDAGEVAALPRTTVVEGARR